jgi:hypothetical protein
VDKALKEAALLSLRVGLGLYFGSGFVLRTAFFFLEAIRISRWLSDWQQEQRNCVTLENGAFGVKSSRNTL